MILAWTLLFESHAPQAAALPMSFAPLDLQDDGKRGKKQKKPKQKQVSDGVGFQVQFSHDFEFSLMCNLWRHGINSHHPSSFWLHTQID